MQNDHRMLAMNQMKLFLTFIRNRYHLHVKELDAELMKKLQVKAQVPELMLRQIRDEYKTINNMSVIEPHQVVEFHSLLDQFYRKCK